MILYSPFGSHCLPHTCGLNKTQHKVSKKSEYSFSRCYSAAHFGILLSLTVYDSSTMCSELCIHLVSTDRSVASNRKACHVLSALFLEH